MNKYSILITFIVAFAATANAQLTHGEAFEEASAAASEDRLESLNLLLSSYSFDYVELNRLLEAAASCGSLESMRALLDKGVRIDVDEEDEDPTCSPLMSAAAYGHADAVRLLLSRGANAKRALNSGRHVLIRMKGSYRSVNDYDGLTAYDFAKAMGNTNVMAIEGLYVPPRPKRPKKDLYAPYPTFRTSQKVYTFAQTVGGIFVLGACSAFLFHFVATAHGQAIFKKYVPKATRML